MIDTPLQGFRFLVTLDPGDAYLPPEQAQLVAQFAGGAFSDVKGLGGELEVLAHPEGGVNDFVHQLPVRHSWSRIVLTRGVVREAGLWQWYMAGQSRSLGARRDGAIILLTSAGNPAMAWNFKAGIAAKWSGPELSGNGNAVAVESLEIAHHGIVTVPLSSPLTP